MKLPPISKKSKLAWTSSYFQNMTGILEGVSIGLSLSKKPYIGVSLGIVSAILSVLKDCDIYQACEKWEKVTDSLICNLIHNYVQENSSFHLKMEDHFTTNFWEISPGIWVASRDQWESWWYPDFKTGIKAFLKNQKYWRMGEDPSSNGNTYYNIKPETPPIFEESPFFYDNVEKISTYLKRGEPRCILFTGPPGTGKSSVITQIANILCEGYLRISFELARSHMVWDLAYLAGFPAIIIDDIDHGNLSKTLLSNLERIKEVTPLVLLSSNSNQSLKGAILRPGRIDEVIEITHPDPFLVKKFSTFIPEKFHKDLEGLYISYIVELNRRCKVQGTEKIEDWILEMHDRAKSVGDGWDSNSLSSNEEEDY